MFARVALVLSAIFLLALGACGGDGPPNATTISSDASEAMAALTSYHVASDDFEEGEGSNMELDLKFAGPDAFEASLTPSEVAELSEIRLLRIGDDFYQRFIDFSSDCFVAPGDESNTIAGAMAFGLAGFAHFVIAVTSEDWDLTYLGEEDIDGIATYHMEGAVAGDLFDFLNAEPLFPESVTVELWIGKDDSLVRRYVFAPDIAGLSLPMIFSRFDDAAITIEAPADPRPAAELDELLKDNRVGMPKDLPEQTESVP